jgi:tetratricopeptide (TPR) repeat protein
MRRAPRTNEVEWKQYYQLLHTHPEQYLRIADDTIRQYPDDPQGYRDCVTYWMHFEQYDCALCDIDHALALRDNTMTRVERGVVLRCLGRYREAIEELSRCEAKAAGMYSPLIEINRAAWHARLGNLEAALADCAATRRPLHAGVRWRPWRNEESNNRNGPAPGRRSAEVVTRDAGGS